MDRLMDGWIGLTLWAWEMRCACEIAYLISHTYHMHYWENNFWIYLHFSVFQSLWNCQSVMWLTSMERTNTGLFWYTAHMCTNVLLREEFMNLCSFCSQQNISVKCVWKVTFFYFSIIHKFIFDWVIFC